MLKMNMEFRKGILFVRLKGVLTKKTASSLNNYLIPVINKHGIKFLVYNLKNIKEIDNYGKASLKKGLLACIKNKGDCFLCNTSLQFNDFKIVRDELTALSLIEV